MSRFDWDSYERRAKHGPLKIGVYVLFTLTLLGGAGLFFSSVFGWCSETAQVARDEFGPRAALDKYEWFKDASAALEKKKADIAVYDKRLTSLSETYTGVARKDWARSDREQYNIWASEVSGIRASYNSLVAEYNANSSKFSWSYAKGQIPQTYEPYLEK